ncbi:hypothetical protein ACFL54_07335 [Planctomycetota bacterium]
MNDKARFENIQKKRDIAKAARSFFLSLGIADWFLMLLMLVAVSNAPTTFQFYQSFLQLGQDDTVVWVLYWNIGAFSLVYLSLLTYFLYLNNYTKRVFSIPLAFFHSVYAGFSILCIFKVAWDKFWESSNKVGIEWLFWTDYRNKLIMATVSSLLIALFFAVRLAKEAPRKAKKSGSEADIPPPVTPQDVARMAEATTTGTANDNAKGGV